MTTPLEQKAADVTQQMRQCDDELRTARERVHYLEQMLLRCDGALTVLRQLIEEQAQPAPAPASSNSAMPQPVAP